MLRPGSLIEAHILPTAPTALSAEKIPLDIVFENDDVLVVNKPAGMVVHPAAGHPTGTLVNAALGHDAHMEGVGGEQRPGIVHRLDKETSGLIVLAKNDAALQYLQAQFRSRQAKKTYLALVDGRPPTREGRIEAAVGRDPNHRKQMAIVPEVKGRSAVTEYRTLELFPLHTLLEVHPQTGRTHQIRLHCAFIGCPVVGDKVYGRKTPSIQLGRHFLHAARLVLSLPGEAQPRAFAAALPHELDQVLRVLRRESQAHRH